MYSVYIVDDETLVIQDLINTISWLENGFEVIGSNTNSMTALPEIIRMKPDVVFSDLKMPGYDGIELIKRSKENGVDAEFIILSGYEEFSACREFLRMGGFDYILKPLDKDDAALTLEQLSRKLTGKHNKTPSIQFKPSQSSNFDDLVTYITQNFSKKHTLDDLSSRYNMNPTYICDLFSKQYNSTLIIFLANLRMQEASRLILGTDMQLKEIAVFCGYQSYHRFCKVFRTHFGKSPSQFREEKV